MSARLQSLEDIYTNTSALYRRTHSHTHTHLHVESESESELYLLPSRFTPTWNLFWCIGAYSEHKTYKHNKYYINAISTTIMSISLVKELPVFKQNTEFTNKTRQNIAHQHTEAAVRGAIVLQTLLHICTDADCSLVPGASGTF